MIIVVIILAIIAIPFIIAIFKPEEYTIEREIVIDKPKSEVFNYVKLLKNQDYYSKWVMTDPGMKKTFTGTDGTVGFIYAWDSENKQAGKGEQEIIKLSGEDRADMEVRFERPFKGLAHPSVVTEALSTTQTKVHWIFKGTCTYMMRVMHIVLNLKKVLGKDMQTSLTTLKGILEK
ncbi:SRPBCC family protein [Mucilaginibacter sp. AW1-3]